ncbi:unnamed protein product [Blepharisma stoltei]|uniref:60S acidic ribosomal protein P2 n=1 Tax=Blepharisma stoltei TaxID=1481888 RepID=A0AAU9JZT4_9CILI|nr:unnamed protein product [Blepharisma stoltei]
MKYLAAYALAWLGGTSHPTVEKLQEIIEAAGSDFDKAKASKLVEDLKDKSLEEVVAQGTAKLGSVSLSAGGAAATTTTTDAGKAKEEPKKEEEKEEKEEDIEGAMDLFGGDEW